MSSRDVDAVRYPEHALLGRLKLAYQWIPQGTKDLLDAGCSYGYATRFFAERAIRTTGVDPNLKAIELARSRYANANIRFLASGTERMPFSDNSFDAVVMTDVLEHVANENDTLNEVYRILRPGGVFIVTVPNKGLFSFLDLDNAVLLFRRSFPSLYSNLHLRKEGRLPEVKPGYDAWHRHYGLGDIISLVRSSRFAGRYRVRGLKRGGLLVEPLSAVLYHLGKLVLRERWSAEYGRALQRLASLDYEVEYGRFAYNLAVCIVKEQ